MLRKLLNTWENWNSRTTLVNTLLRGLGHDALDVTVDQARASYGEVIDRQERLRSRDVDLYRAVI